MLENFLVEVIEKLISYAFIHLGCKICSRQRKATQARFHFGMLCGPRSVIVTQVVPMSAGARLACLATRLELSFLVIEVYISLSKVIFACILLILKQLNLILHMRHYLAILEGA